MKIQQMLRAQATIACPSMFTERCNLDETWREQQWGRLACWENGVGYDAGERFAMFCVCAKK